MMEMSTSTERQELIERQVRLEVLRQTKRQGRNERQRECKKKKVKSKSERRGKNGKAGHMVGKLNNELNDTWCIMK